jgi:hypothetical protein
LTLFSAYEVPGVEGRPPSGLLSFCLLDALEKHNYLVSYRDLWDMASVIKTTTFQQLPQDIQFGWSEGALPGEFRFLQPSRMTIPPR